MSINALSDLRSAGRPGKPVTSVAFLQLARQRNLHMTSTAAPAIELRDVGFRLASGRELIAELNLNIARGETLVLLGRSGSGKTTSLKLINRMLELTSGEIIVDGRNQTAWDPLALRRGIGYVMQDAGLFPHWTVEQNVGLVPRLDK